MPTPNIMGFNTGDTYNGAPGSALPVGLSGPSFARDAAQKGWLTTSPGIQ